MRKSNWIIIWHDRHCDDRYKIVMNATLEEANAVELDVAKKAGWQDQKEASKYGFGDYGYGEDYYINMIELDGKYNMNDIVTIK